MLKERGEKDRSRIVLVLVIAFLRAGFEDEDENENEISAEMRKACRKGRRQASLCGGIQPGPFPFRMAVLHTKPGPLAGSAGCRLIFGHPGADEPEQFLQNG